MIFERLEDSQWRENLSDSLQTREQLMQEYLVYIRSKFDLQVRVVGWCKEYRLELVY